MALPSLSPTNNFSSPSSYSVSPFSSKFPTFHRQLNSYCTRHLLLLRECTSSSSFLFRGGKNNSAHGYCHFYAPRERKTMTVAAASLGGLLGGIFKGGADTGESTRQQYSATVALINSLESELTSLSDSQLRDRTTLLRQRARQGPQSLDSILPVSTSHFYITFGIWRPCIVLYTFSPLNLRKDNTMQEKEITDFIFSVLLVHKPPLVGRPIFLFLCNVLKSLLWLLEVLCSVAYHSKYIYNIVQEAFAIVREASKRVLGLRPFDVQLIGK